MTTDEYIAHLYWDKDQESWIRQTCLDHSHGVARLAARFAEEFEMGDVGRIIGLLHDRGKEKPEFQKYIRDVSGYDASGGAWGDKSHSIIGARLASRHRFDCYHMLSNPIAGHHRGLYDTFALEPLLNGDIPPTIDSSMPDIVPSAPRYGICQYDIHHIVRMLFSCLVDADYLDTERFMHPDDFSVRGLASGMPELRSRLEQYLDGFRACRPTELNRLRTWIQDRCRKASTGAPGFYELTVPTGGGKTIASVVWAVNHAICHDKKRIVIAIPFTSIIVQTAQILRTIFGDENVVEHHSVMDDDKLSFKNRLACENWDAPVIVTTNVQLFESMFANRPGRCRKLHSLCNSVIILDETQALPLTLLQPVTDAMQSYVRMFGVSFLFCTASQPILDGERKGSGQARFAGIPTEKITSVISPEARLHDRLRRVDMRIDPEDTSLEDVAHDLSAHNRVLCIVNTRRIAARLYAMLPEEGVTAHLSRMMCPAHIMAVIASVRRALAVDAGTPVRVVSTQLIEAGVDIDFPVVYRQLAGLDSLLQAAGRCNREGKAVRGTTRVFSLKGERSVGYVATAADTMKEMISRHSDADWFSPDTISEYFRRLYARITTFDKADIATLAGSPQTIAYEEVAAGFRLIDDDGVPLTVNYGDAEELISALRRNGPSAGLLKKLGQYSVSVPRRLFDSMIRDGLVEEPWEGFYYVATASQYDSRTGLKTGNEFMEQNLII